MEFAASMMQSAIAARSVALYSGARLDFVSPRADCLNLADISECLARTDAVFAGAGHYSLAQRAKILAEHAGRQEGALASCYALLRDAGLALLRSVSPFEICGEGLSGIRTRHDMLMTAIHEAVELDWPAPQPIGAVLRHLGDQLALRELMTLRQNVEFEITRLRRQQVTPLAHHICPKPREKAQAEWCGTWKVMATAAQLRRTAAWSGV